MPEAQPSLTAVPSASPVLDAASLAQLRQLDPSGTGGFVQRVLSTYERSLQQHLQQARIACDAADWQALGKIAHALKSASASVGALGFSGLCADLEGRVRLQQLEALEPLCARFFAEAERVRQALAEQLGAPAA